MTNGTIIRTAMFVLTTINMILAQFETFDFGNETATYIYKVLSLTFSAVAGSVALYYNNDFTAEGRAGTKLTRELKANRLSGEKCESGE